MAKLVVLILSDPKDQRKIFTGLKFAKVARESGELEDVRLIISAQAVGIFKELAFKEVIDEIKSAVPVMACKMNVEGVGVVDEVESYGIPLAPVGKELIRFIKEGYVVTSF
ncbi:MAG: DsrE family protein [Nitrospirae bacterium]|nr:DsrE family protein [Nitrospirota bacterium]MCL5421802.1 DsrE family protein [Nitrospirota bacterium]